MARWAVVELREPVEAEHRVGEGRRGDSLPVGTVVFGLGYRVGHGSPIGGLRTVLERVSDRQPRWAGHVEANQVGEAVTVAGAFEVDEPAVVVADKEVVSTVVGAGQSEERSRLDEFLDHGQPVGRHVHAQLDVELVGKHTQLWMGREAPAELKQAIHGAMLASPKVVIVGTPGGNRMQPANSLGEQHECGWCCRIAGREEFQKRSARRQVLEQHQGHVQVGAKRLGRHRLTQISEKP